MSLLVRGVLAKGREFLLLCREAVGNTERDYTSGSIRRALVLLAVPMVLEMAMESIFVLVDAWFVSRLGSAPAAAVGLTELALTLLYAACLGLSVGATALVARRIGEGDRRRAQQTAGQIIWVGLFLSLLLGVAGVIHADRILALMGAAPDVIEIGRGYTATMLGGSATILMIFLLNGIFRGAGNAVIAMRALWIANGVNLVLDPCLIFGLGPFPDMGVTGAAVATNIGRGCGVAYQLWCISRAGSGIRLTAQDLRIDWSTLLHYLRVSVPGALQFAVAMSSYIALMRIIADYGTQAVAGFFYAVRVFAFTFLPAWGLGNAAATLVGQNLGAGKPDRAEQSVWMAARWNAAFLLFIAVFFITVPGWFAAPFTDDPVVRQYVVDCLRIVSISYGFYAVGMILTQAFNGAGDTDTPTWINFVCLWLVQLPLAWWLSREAGWGPQGVYASIVAADTSLAIVAIVVFRRGRWKLRQV